MKDPCEICMDKDRCGGSQPCQKKNSLWQIQKEMQRNCEAYEKSDATRKRKTEK